ncbi:MAG: hypothetical protein ABSH01_08585 [Terriglobia bacterium]|jgi:hypothetical protein
MKGETALVLKNHHPLALSLTKEGGFGLPSSVEEGMGVVQVYIIGKDG